MLNLRFVANRLAELTSRRRPSKRASIRRRACNQLLPVPAEVSRLESRALLSTTALGGEHLKAVPLAKSRGGADFVEFAGYKWDTNYHYNADSGWYNNGQQWAPQNVKVVDGKMHLYLREATVGGKYTAFSSAEAVLEENSAGQPVTLGYGTYLVSAKTAGSFNELGNNHGAIFGAFTYENLHGNGTVDGNSITGLPASVVAELKVGYPVSANNYEGTAVFPVGTTIQSISGGTVTLTQTAILPGAHTFFFSDNTLVNSHRELDMIEASRFGIKTDPTNAQFTLQPSDSNPANVHRITLEKDKGEITIVMNWPGANTPVTFSEYNGIHTLAQVKTLTPDITWTTASDQNQFIPNTGNQQFHLNLWQAFWKIPPTPKPQEVTVEHFQYQPE